MCNASDMTDFPDTLVGTSEAAKLLGVDRSTVTRLVQTGRLDPMHKGAGRTSSYTFRASDIERERRRREAQS